jgi:hypothetical protein
MPPETLPLHQLTLELRSCLGPHLAETIAQALHTHCITLLAHHQTNHITIERIAAQIAHAREVHEQLSHPASAAQTFPTTQIQQYTIQTITDQMLSHVDEFHSDLDRISTDDILDQFSHLIAEMNTLTDRARCTTCHPAPASEALSAAQRAEVEAQINSAIRTHCEASKYPAGSE